MASKRVGTISANVKRVIYISLAAFFMSRIYISCLKLMARDVSFSQKIIKEDPQMYPSFTMCVAYYPFFGPDMVAAWSRNLTEVFIAHKVLIDRITELTHQYENENGWLLIQDGNGIVDQQATFWNCFGKRLSKGKISYNPQRPQYWKFIRGQPRAKFCQGWQLSPDKSLVAFCFSKRLTKWLPMTRVVAPNKWHVVMRSSFTSCFILPYVTRWDRSRLFRLIMSDVQKD